MSLPGLGLSQPDEQAPPAATTTQHEISERAEWRFEVAVGSYVKIQLLSGTAEIFGTEIVSGQPYTFTGTKAAVYTWHGCIIEASGDACQSEYTAEETPMIEYANVHFALETLRGEAKQQGREGPRALIVGPDNAGKTSLAKILTGYAVKIGRQPMVVNLDTKEGMLSIPGTMTAAAFKTMIDVEDGWGSSPMSGPSAIPVKLPLAYYYGLPDPNDEDGRIYRLTISRLALAVTGRLASDEAAREAGVIIDTPGSISQVKPGSTTPYASIAHIISEFSITAILVLGSERLYSDLQKRFDGKPSTSTTSTTLTPTPISVIKVSKSGGCVDRDESFMISLRAAQVRNYFFGNPKLTNGINLSPHQQTVDFAVLAVYRLLPAAPSSAAAVPADLFAPGGSLDPDYESEAEAERARKSEIKNLSSLSASSLFSRLEKPSAAMTHSVLAVLNTPPPSTSPSTGADDDALFQASVMGFLYVTEVDDTKGRITILSPLAGRLPDSAIIWGGWPEESVGLV